MAHGGKQLCDYFEKRTTAAPGLDGDYIEFIFKKGSITAKLAYGHIGGSVIG
jgi:hypothetical protein